MSIQEPKQKDTIENTIEIVSSCLGSCVDLPEHTLSTGRNMKLKTEGNLIGYINLCCNRLNKCGLAYTKGWLP